VQRKVLLPEFYNSSYEGWAVNYLDKNFWKFQESIGTFEDALAEASLVFYECRRLYGARATTGAHFMSLFKRMMVSWFTDWALYDSKQREIAELYEVLAKRNKAVYSEGGLAVLIRDGSTELQQVIGLILNAPQEVLVVLRKDVKDGLDAFFTHAVEFCGLPKASAPALEEELRELLS